MMPKGEKAEKPALENRAADAEHADGADRNGDHEADGDAFQKEDKKHEAAEIKGAEGARSGQGKARQS